MKSLKESRRFLAMIISFFALYILLIVLIGVGKGAGIWDDLIYAMSGIVVAFIGGRTIRSGNIHIFNRGKGEERGE